MNIIVAVDEHFGIGNLGKIQWKIKEDMDFFRRSTLNKTVIMGRKTLDSFKCGKPLKNRHNIVLTRDKCFKRECNGCAQRKASFRENIRYRYR